MVIERGDVWWAELDRPDGSEPGYRRPVLVVQSDAFNRSRIRSVIVIACTSNMRLLDAPGNVLLPMAESGLPRDSVLNVSQLLTIDRERLQERSGTVDMATMLQVEAGLHLVLELS